MNTVYIISLILTIFSYSPMPRVDSGMLVARFELFVDPETREIRVETTFDRTCIPNDCTALLLLMEVGDKICSQEELDRYIHIKQRDTEDKLLIAPKQY